MSAKTKEIIIGSLRHCAKRECGLCAYQGRGIACRHHLMIEAADLLEKELVRQEYDKLNDSETDAAK